MHPSRNRTWLTASSTAGVLLCAGALVACSGADDSSSREAAPTSGGSGGSSTGGSGGFLSGDAAAGSSGSGVGGTAGAGGTGGTGVGGGFGSAGAAGGGGTGGGNTNVSLGGSQDFGYFRKLLADGRVPRPGDFDAAGFFAEHHTPLPPPACGERICLQPMLGVMGNLMTGVNCTMLQIGLNSPIVADPTNRPPLSLTVVVDVSGSMNQGGKIDFVRSGLEHMIDGLRDEDRFALVTYDDSVEIPFAMNDVRLNRTAIKNIVRGLAAGGGTNLHGGLERGYEESLNDYDSGRQNRVIMLSDGQPTSGVTSESAILDMSKGYNSDGIGLTTIGLGTGFNVNLMRNLALQADGNFYFLENSTAVEEVFTEELNYFTVPVAFDLSVDVRSGSLYDFGRAYGTPFWTDTSEGGRLEVPSVFLAHRESSDDVFGGEGRRGGGSALLIELMPGADDGSSITSADVAVIDVQFREPGTNRIVTDSVTVMYPFAPWVTPLTGHFDAPDPEIVQKSFVMLNMYVGIEEACAEFHAAAPNSQRMTDAIEALGNLILAVEDYNEEVADKDIELDLDMLRQLRDVMIQNGVVPPVNPAPPTDPWPAD